MMSLLRHMKSDQGGRCRVSEMTERTDDVLSISFGLEVEVGWAAAALSLNLQ